MARVIPDSARLTPAQIRALPDGTRIVVRWCGGNGPHLYTLRRRSHDGAPPYDVYGCSVLPDGSEVDSGLILAWNHEETWGARLLEDVWVPTVEKSSVQCDSVVDTDRQA